MPSAARIHPNRKHRAAIAPRFFVLTGIGTLAWILSAANADEPPVEKVLHVPVAERKFSNEELEFFEKRVRPLLVKRCYECHVEKEEPEGGLRLDSRERFLRGGDTGPAIVPGKPKSQLVDRCDQSRRAVSDAAKDQTAR